MSPGHYQLTLLMASNPEAAEAGPGPHRKPTAAKNSTQGINRVLQASIRATRHGGDTTFQGSQDGELGIQSSATPYRMGPPGGEVQADTDTS